MKSLILTILSAVFIAGTGTCVAAYHTVEPVYLNSREPVYLNSHGIYVKGFGGVNLLHNPKWHHAKYRTNTGFVAGAALGYHFRPLKVEGEFSYRRNDVNRLTIEALNIDASGHIEQWCGLGNVLLEVPLGSCFAPYIGVGAGYRHSKPGVNFDERSDISVQSFIDSADEWGVYQAIAGFNFAVSNCIRVAVDYRYLDGWSRTDCQNHTVALNATFQF